MSYAESVQLEMIKTGLVCCTLVFGWVIGQRIITYWDIKKKRQELDIAAATQFHKLYGEFKEVSRLWRAFSFIGERSKQLIFPETIPLELLSRAVTAEGGVEAIIVKLATERVLEEDDIKTLGLFRQAYQQLRQAIRNGESLEWTYDKPEYHLFNDLACKTTCIISSNKTKKSPESSAATNILRQITSIRSIDWDDELNRLATSLEGKGVS
ncbi:MAG: hypothetical protein HXX11_21125 [Desulfuromonadales bacterium]|nr:hypothetical protein [Desulfuromonadales bacterium]